MILAVFQFEMLRAARRRRGHFLRWFYAALVLVQITPLFFLSRYGWARLQTGFDAFGFFAAFLVQHYVLLALLTPALVGGSITEEKARGTLQHLLTAHIRPGEIIVGKLLAHTYQLVLLTLVGLPLFCFFAGLAGDVSFPIVVLATSWAIVLGVASFSMLVSVWCRTTRDALLCVYVLMGLGVLLVPLLLSRGLTPWLATFNPFPILAAGDATWGLLGRFLLGWLVLAGLCVVLASWRLRRAFRRQLEVKQPKKARWWRGNHGKVRGNPVLWREQRVEGIAPMEGLRRFPRWLGLVAVATTSLGALGFALLWSLPAGVNALALIQAGQWVRLENVLHDVAGQAFYWQGLGVLLVLTLAAAIRASGAITGEKEHGTWLALMLTPLTTQKIISGKHWGIFWACVPYIAGHALVTVPLGVFLGPEAATWAILWTAMMPLAVILASALGLWSSARAASSWRSLATTLVLFYLGWLLFAVPVTVGLAVLKGVVKMFLLVISFFEDTSAPLGFVQSVSTPPWAVCLGVAAAFWFLTHRLLAAAVARVGRNDRTSVMELDYFYLYHTYQRRKQREELDTPRYDGVYQLEVGALGKIDEDAAPIPFQRN